MSNVRSITDSFHLWHSYFSSYATNRGGGSFVAFIFFIVCYEYAGGGVMTRIA